MKKILLQLAEGVNTFDCDWKGKSNKCKILKLDLECGRAFVRFEKPVKVIINKLIEESDLFLQDGEYEKVEEDSYEEWIAVN